MNASRYNRIIELETGVRLLFNARTAALVEIDAETQPTVSRILAKPESAVTPQELEIHDGLLEGGFIVPSEHDEIAQLEAKQVDRRTRNPDFFLTIAPTLACNFECEYCFQRHETGHMTRETEAALVRFSEEHIRGSRSLFVTWFGGEPTLCLPTIERLQVAFSALASSHGVTVHPAAIVSNGSRLDGNVASRLRSAGVAAAQVTLDGPEPEHDRRRYQRGGQGTFRSILNNLTKAADILHVTIRVNVDRGNMEGAPEVLRELRESGLLSRVQIYFAPVKDSAGACADMTGRCFTNEEFARIQLEIYEHLVARGFTEVEYPEPAPGGFCGADTENGYVVAPNGLLFKCWEELSLDGAKSIGSVLTREVTPAQKRNQDRYRSWSPFEKTECVQCNILPLCMGGCPLDGLALASPNRGSCTSWKHSLSGMLRLRYICEQGKEVIP